MTVNLIWHSFGAFKTDVWTPNLTFGFVGSTILESVDFGGPPCGFLVCSTHTLKGHSFELVDGSIEPGSTTIIVAASRILEPLDLGFSAARLLLFVILALVMALSLDHFLIKGQFYYAGDSSEGHPRHP
ncbi:hypothetical protein V6N13_100383 [Hibiscus sabdariffa]